MSELGKVTAFVVTAARPHHLLVFNHPLVGLQLPAGTVEPGESAVEAARREVWEETGVEVASRGVVLGEQISQLDPNRAVLLETVEGETGTLQRGHKVIVTARDEARGVARVREEIYDYAASPPKLLSAMEGDMSTNSLTHRIRRTSVLFVEQADPTRSWSRRADGHDFEVHWRLLRPDLPLAERQLGWLTSNYRAIDVHLETMGADTRIELAKGRGHVAACEQILRSLPAWFGIEEAIVDYVEQIARLPTFVASTEHETTGFLSIERHGEHAAEIIVMAVAPSHHRNDVGRELVAAAEEYLRGQGVEFLQVKTLSPSHDSPEYARTRRFYRAVGFRPLQEFPTLWDEANPCLQMVKWLG